MNRQKHQHKKKSIKKTNKSIKKTVKKSKVRGKQINSPHYLNNLSLKNSIQETSFRGYGEDIIMGLLYLLGKHSNFNILIGNLSNIEDDFMWKIVISWICQKDESDFQLKSPMNKTAYFNKLKKYIKNYKQNGKKRFVLIPIYLGSKSCDISKGHFNIGILDIEYMKLERFEPYGYHYKKEEHEIVDSKLEEALKKNGIHIEVISPYKIMTSKSFQEIEELEVRKGMASLRSTDPGGFCGAWGIWFCDMRLKFPKMSTSSLIDRALSILMKSKDKKSFRNFIRNYSAFLVAERKKILGVDRSVRGQSLSNQIRRIIYEKKQKGEVGIRDSKYSIIEKIRQNVNSVKCNFMEVKGTKFIGKGVTNTVVSGCLDTKCSQQVAIRIMSSLLKHKSPRTNPVNVEIRLYEMFNELNRKNISPHSPIMFNSFDCKYSDLFKKDNTNSISKSYKSKIDEGKIDDKIKIMVLEYCPYGTMEDITDTNESLLHIKVAIFQVLLGISTLQYHIPGFRHNDIHNNNVIFGNYNFKGEELYFNQLKGGGLFVKSISNSISDSSNTIPSIKKNNYYIEYKFLGKSWYLPYLGFCAKIFDLDTSCSEKIKNIKITEDLYLENGVTCQTNPVFDFHLFMNSSFYDYSGYTEIYDFYQRHIPYEYRGNTGDYLGFSRLTNFNRSLSHAENDVNLVPKNIKSAVEVLNTDKLFKEFLSMDDNGEAIMTYDTEVPDFSSLKGRKDMIN